MKEYIPKDFFGQEIRKKDIILYAPGSQRKTSLKVAVAEDVSGNKMSICFIGDNGINHKVLLSLEILKERTFLLVNSGFFINNKFIKNAIIYRDNLL